ESLNTRIEAAGKNVARLAEVPQIQQTPAVQQLRNEIAEARSRYTALGEAGLGEKHPEMIKAHDAVDALTARFRLEVLQASDALTAQYQVAQATEARLAESFNSQKQTLLN